MLISSETARFVAEHRTEDVRDLALKAKRVGGLDLPLALDQIAGWQTARTKLPQWAACEGIVYPPHISMEQCSSEFAARYKAEVARRIVGERSAANGSTIDLTGGFGVDFSYIARGFARAIYVERQKHLCELAEHNMRALGLDHVTVINGDAETVLDGETATLIFVDPARRDEHGGRTVAIEDCTPDVLALRDRLLAAAPHVMIKLSPMLDWRKAVGDFRGAVSEVHIVSTGNECKELLLVLDRARVTDDEGRMASVPPQSGKAGQLPLAGGADVPEATGARAGQLALAAGGAEGVAMSESLADGQLALIEGAEVPGAAGAKHHGGKVRVYCVNDGDRLDYEYDPADTAATNRSLGLAPLPEKITYLYEPNASIMKAGCFALVEDRYGLTQIGPNSHLFVSGDDRPIAGFPGRTFAVDTVTAMGKKELKRALADVAKANVAVRNFPLTVAQLRKKLRLNDGGDIYLFATTLAGAKHVILRCHKA
ncbi:class I SAM-dependent methyltransferase [Bifidobacterium aerophilum]|uniref:SAM-dependent methyltransferase n=1 Tax=Bifidobacterium aerophilum TaxID=1798155 RepID=A0A6N9Z757_9BIFI|nr:SAM-dependent methyltransferase [Bifidobacterium aerophilum]NEG90472.1 SAM-dependent methyltransferase [Bifidobacterium aerophilum]